MQAGTLFAPDLLKYGHVAPNTADQRKCSFEFLWGSIAPSLVPNAALTPQTRSLSLLTEQNSALFVFYPVKFGDLAVSALVDSGAIHNFHEASLLSSLRDSPSFISIVPCHFQITLVDGGVIQAAKLATLALEVVDDHGVIVPGMLALKFYIIDMLPA